MNETTPEDLRSIVNIEKLMRTVERSRWDAKAPNEHFDPTNPYNKQHGILPIGAWVPAPSVREPISKRALKILAKAGINDVYDLTDTSEATLRKLRGMGHGLVREIKEALEENGMSLANGEPTYWSGFMLYIEGAYFVRDVRLHFGEISAEERMERLRGRDTPTPSAEAAFGTVSAGEIEFPPLSSYRRIGGASWRVARVL